MALTGRNVVQINEVKTSVTENDQDVKVNIVQQDVEVVLGFSGPQGPKGEPGSIGEGVVAYTHIQSTPSDTWTVNHGLSFYPNITVVDSAGTVVEGSYEYLNSTTVVLRFSGAFSGKAYLS